MPRLMDRILDEHWAFVGDPLININETNAKIRKILDDTMVVVADNVAQYWEDHNLVLPMNEMPPLGPSFKTMWFEARTPSAVLADRSGGFKEFGALVIARDYNSDTFLSHKDYGFPEGTRWQLEWYLFGVPDEFLYSNFLLPIATKQGFGVKRDVIWGPILQYTANVDARGNWLPLDPAKPEELHAAILTKNILGTRDGWRDAENSFYLMAISYLRVLVFALGLMNCKNVVAVDVPPIPALSKKRKKRTGKPLVTYKVLEIDAKTRERARRIGAESESERFNRIHVCRGHFRTYTPDNPLFGQPHPNHIGSFWIPAHVRGSKEEGMVHKDYQINP